MPLTPTDLNYIIHRMEMYDIKYQEVYDEIKDHVISAVEDMRAKGDRRNIVELFDDMMNTQFPGYWAFAEISKEYEKAYRKKIRKTIWANIRAYINFKSVLAMILSVALAVYLPRNKITMLIFFIALLLVALTPGFYAWLKTKAMHLDDGKQSLVKNHLMGFVANEYDIKFLKPINYHPVICMLLLCFFVIYSLSSMRLCRQELKLDLNQ
jgi:hypothetical protein